MGTCPTRSHSHMVLENHSVPESTDIQESIIVALQNYPSIGQTELTMRIGDRLTVTSNDGDFMMVKSLTTECESYIPSKYTAEVTHRWLYTGISRFKAVELLMLPENITGSFLIRESETTKDGHSLSVLRRGSRADLDSVKHYRISHLPNGWVFISPGLTFPSLMRLIDHYTENTAGLCCRLTKPCYICGLDQTRPTPRVIRRPTMNWKDMSRSLIFRQKATDSNDSQVSEGLREAISSYLEMTEDSDLNWDM
ncbi:src-like-adapter 2 [Eucyclogobius newberryi]|uniref:src-like-adapter 2 n=1 Tax=Eucyclogobius newberryi TaxID=166745 RepID=UPI003B5C7719